MQHDHDAKYGPEVQGDIRSMSKAAESSARRRKLLSEIESLAEVAFSERCRKPTAPADGRAHPQDRSVLGQHEFVSTWRRALRALARAEYEQMDKQFGTIWGAS